MQLPDETNSAWRCRLKDLLGRAHTSGLSMPNSQPLNKMMRDQFWGGLHDHPKEPMRYQMSKITDFDEFCIEARKLAKDELTVK